tara:strand:- start:449 stop:703 length:255 start_codon:yes stop_codon:yes gene_type:complete
MNDYIRCYLSEIGHKNFWYPTTTQAVVSSECVNDKLPWVTGANRGLVAIKVLKSCILPLSYNEKTIKNVDPPSGDDYTVVWIDK